MATRQTTARNESTGTTRRANIEQIVDLFGFIGLHEMGAALAASDNDKRGPERRRGRRCSYPPTMMLAVTASARITGSTAQALETLRDPEVWTRCCTAFALRDQTSRVPSVPPNRDQVRYFRERFEEHPQLLRDLQGRFQQVAIGQARHLGNLLPDTPYDGANPNPRNTIYSDGTVIAPFTDVTQITHPGTGEIHAIGSRAKGKPRIQEVLSDTSQDGKTARGINMVGVYTWTRAGRVVLGTGSALGAEQWTVLDLIDSIQACVRQRDSATERHDGVGAVHTLVHDGAITGWTVDYLMGAHGIQVLSKGVAAGDPLVKTSVTERVERLRGEYQSSKRTDFLLRRDVLADMLRYHEALPLGISIYPTTRHEFDLVHSVAIELDPFTHPTPSGGICTHGVAVDDGSLFEIQDHPEAAYAVKIGLVTCQRSDRHRRPDGRWATRNTYRLSCPRGDFEVTRDWAPEGTRWTAETQGERKPLADRVGWRLRPLSRPDDLAEYFNEKVPAHLVTCKKFSDHFGRRNDAESYNQWFQRSQPHHGRATALSLAGQELDFLLGALLNNSITWHRRLM